MLFEQLKLSNKPKIEQRPTLDDDDESFNRYERLTSHHTLIMLRIYTIEGRMELPRVDII